MQGEESTAEEIPRAATMPSNLQFSARGFADEEYAKEAIYKLHTVLSVISQSIDLTKLDGVTIAFDYDQALAELDRGYETAYKLTASNLTSTLRLGFEPGCAVRKSMKQGVSGFEGPDFRQKHVVARLA